MDRLLLGYASSDDDQEAHNPTSKGEITYRACADAGEIAVNDQGFCGGSQLPGALADGGKEEQGASKRHKVNGWEAVNSSIKQPHCITVKAAFPAAPPAVATAAARRPVARSVGPLPNPIALLAASTAEERLSVLAAEAAAAPPPPLTVAAPPRVRSFPHVVGNFPTVVLLPVQGLEEALDAMYRKVRRLLPDLEPMAQEPPPPGVGPASSSHGGSGRGRGRDTSPPSRRGYHVSLSRTAPIRHPQIAPLTSLLSERLKAMACSFSMSLGGLRSFTNEDGTRSFVSAMVTRGSEQVCSLIRHVDYAFSQHGLPTFYQEPLPHVSVGWLSGDQRARIDQALQRLQQQQQQEQQRGHQAGRSVPPHPAASGADVAEVVVGPWQASRALCVVGQRGYEVWRPPCPV